MPKADMEEEIDLKVGEAGVGIRLDVFLAGSNAVVSRSQAQRLIEEGCVSVNGVAEKARFKLRAGDTVTLRIPEPEAYEVVAEDIPLDIVYEDEAVVVVNKAAGMVVHPAAGNFHGTLVNALLFHCRDLSGVGGVLRPGVVHRLDKDTSGLLVVARGDAAHVGLARQFKEHRVKKVYSALVFGDTEGEEGSVALPVGRHPGDRKKMSVFSRHGKEALTRWKVVERFGVMALLDVAIETGRTHQIRVHLNSIGHPILGDEVYGNSSRRLQAVRDTTLLSMLRGMRRQALHARGLGFYHPLTNRYLWFESPLPEDMQRVVAYLREYTRGTHGVED